MNVTQVEELGSDAFAYGRSRHPRTALTQASRSSLASTPAAHLAKASASTCGSTRANSTSFSVKTGVRLPDWGFSHSRPSPRVTSSNAVASPSERRPDRYAKEGQAPRVSRAERLWAATVGLHKVVADLCRVSPGANRARH